MKKGLIVVIVVLAIAIGFYIYRDLSRIRTDDAYVHGNITSIAPKVSGEIVNIFVKDNQYVEKGQLLLKIDDRDYQQQYERTTNALISSNAHIQELKARYTYQQQLIQKAKATLDSKHANLVNATHDYHRYSSLKQTGAVAYARFDNARNTYQEQLSLYQAEQSNLAAEKVQLKILTEQIAVAQAERDEMKNEQQLAQLHHSYTLIKAPKAGIIGNRSAQLGSYVSAGNVLFSLVPVKHLWIIANFKEDDVRGLHPLQSVKVTVDSFPDTPIYGHIDSFSPGTAASFSAIPSSRGTGNFVRVVQRIPVKIILDDIGDRQLLPGMSAVVSIQNSKD